MKLKTREITIFALLGTIMYVSKMIMEFAPNIHLLGVFTIAFTIVYGKKALYPIYTYVLINGVMAGFSTWWVPYLYIWTILWAGAMLVSKKLISKIPSKMHGLVYMILCSVHGFSYGILYAPAQSIFFGLSFEGTIAWIVTGFPFDAIHGVSNFFCGILILPIAKLLKKLEKM